MTDKTKGQPGPDTARRAAPELGTDTKPENYERAFGRLIKRRRPTKREADPDEPTSGGEAHDPAARLKTALTRADAPETSHFKKAAQTVRVAAKRAETKPEAEAADRAMAQVEKAEASGILLPARQVANPDTEQGLGKRRKMTDAEHNAEFEKVAREHGAEGDDKALADAMRRIAKPTPR